MSSVIKGYVRESYPTKVEMIGTVTAIGAETKRIFESVKRLEVELIQKAESGSFNGTRGTGGALITSEVEAMIKANDSITELLKSLVGSKKEIEPARPILR